MQEDNVCAVILAAGRGSRMGRTKQLLPFHEQTMLETVIKQVAKFPFKEIIIVIGHEAEKIKQTIDLPNKRCTWLYNEQYMLGQSTSVKKALKYAEDKYMATMIFLGDLPFIQDTTLQTIYNKGVEIAQTKEIPYIVRPIFEQTPGHPVLIGKVHQEVIEKLAGDKGLQSMKEYFKYKKMIPVEDYGIIFDIDTQAQYKQAMKHLD